MPLDRDLLLGQIAVKYAFITPEQLQECINIQESLSEYKPIGLIMIEKGFITSEMLDTIIRLQQENIEKKTKDGLRRRQDNLFGRILIAKNILPKEKVFAAVREQARLLEKGIHKRLGCILYEWGLLSVEQINEVLDFQNKKILYCERCNIIFTVEWVLGRKYACTKCGERLLVPPRAALIDRSELVLRERPSQPVPVERPVEEPKTKYDLSGDFRRIVESVEKSSTSKTQSVSLPYVSTISVIFHLLLKPASLILLVLAFILFLIIRSFGYKPEYSRGVHFEGVVERKLADYITAKEIALPAVSPRTIESAIEFTKQDVYENMFRVLSFDLEKVFPEIKVRGREFYDLTSGKKLSKQEIDEMIKVFREEIKKVTAQLYYIYVSAEVTEKKSKSLSLFFPEFQITDVNLRERIEYKDSIVDVSGPFFTSAELMRSLNNKYIVFFGCLRQLQNSRYQLGVSNIPSHYDTKYIENKLKAKELRTKLIFFPVLLRNFTDGVLMKVSAIAIEDEEKVVVSYKCE